MSSLEISKLQIYFKQLFQLKVGDGSHLQTYYQEKIEKLSIFSDYVHQCQRSHELPLP